MKKMRLLACYFMLINCFNVIAEQKQPADFVTINTFIPDLIFDIRYYSTNNFIGKKIDGYYADKCILQSKAASALKKVYHAAKSRKLNLKIFDCYRPQSAVDHFVRWAKDHSDTKMKQLYYPRLNKDTLIGPYIAAKSGHSRGATVDLTLVEQVNGHWQELDMGSAWDLFDEISNTDSNHITQPQQANRYLLKHLMAQAGFSAYDMEWWHFSLAEQPYSDTYFNFMIK